MLRQTPEPNKTTNPPPRSIHVFDREVDVNVYGTELLGFTLRPVEPIEIEVGAVVSFKIVQVDRKVTDRG